MSRLAAALLALLALPAWGFDFRSAAADGVILYDAPSREARKLSLVTRGYPFEVLVSLEGWTKVRDSSGDIAWVEGKSLSPRRTVVVAAPFVELRQAPDDGSPVVFRAERDVILELIDFPAPAWARVRHQDGETGHVRVTQIWGS